MSNKFVWIPIKLEAPEPIKINRLSYHAPLKTNLLVEQGASNSAQTVDTYTNIKLVDYKRDSAFPCNISEATNYDKLPTNVPYFAHLSRMGILFTAAFYNECSLVMGQYDGFYVTNSAALAPDGSNTATEISETWTTYHGFRKPPICKFSIKHDPSDKYSKDNGFGYHEDFNFSFHLKFEGNTKRAIEFSARNSKSILIECTPDHKIKLLRGDPNKVKFVPAPNGFTRIILFCKGHDGLHYEGINITKNQYSKNAIPFDVYTLDGIEKNKVDDAKVTIWGTQIARGRDASPYIPEKTEIKKSKLTIPYYPNMPPNAGSFRISFSIKAKEAYDKDSHRIIDIVGNPATQDKDQFYFSRENKDTFAFVYADKYDDALKTSGKDYSVDRYKVKVTGIKNDLVKVILEYDADENATRIFIDGILKGERKDHGTKSTNYDSINIQSMQPSRVDGLVPFWISDFKIHVI